MSLVADVPGTGPRAPRGAVAKTLRRWGSLAMLWTDAEYRRGFYRLLAVELRVLLGMRLLLGIVVLGACIGWLMVSPLPDAQSGWRFLARLFGGLAILFGAPIFASEQRQGTFELVWLATGSKGAMVQMKTLALLIAQMAMAIPCIFVFNRFLGGSLPFALTAWCLLVSMVFVTGLMALLGTFLVQPWAGGLVGACILAPAMLLMEDWNQPLNLFAPPFIVANVAVGRSVAFVLGLVMLYVSAERLSRVIRG